MSDTFRSLCVDLVDVLKLHCNDCEFSWGVIERTEKLLSQSEPEFTTEEIDMNAAPWSLLTPTQSSLEEALRDAIGGLRYIEQHYGRLYGVGWDRVYNNAELLLCEDPKTTLTQSSDYSEPEELTDDDIEEAAAIIYESMRFGAGPLSTPPWMEHGNSLM
jgi:hypothetical protein